MNRTINTQISVKVNKFFYRLKNHLSLPEVKFLKELVIGIIKKGDVHIFPIARSLREDKKNKHVDKRLRRNIGKVGLWREVVIGFLKANKYVIDRMRYFVVDGSDIQKCYAMRMEYLDRVRDGNRGMIGNGYWLLNILGVSRDRCDIMNVFGELFSFQEFIGSMNDKVFNALEVVFSVIKRAGKVLVLDRGFDGIRVIEGLMSRGYSYVLRLTRQRHVCIGGKKVGYQRWQKIPLTKRVILDKITKAGKLKRVKYRAGVVEVRLPDGDYQDKVLWLLVMKKQGYGIKKDQGFSYFLGYFTNEMSFSEVLEEMVGAYGSRWRIEEFHRQVKMNFALESISLQRYEALKNMTTIVLALASYLVTMEFKRLMMGIIEAKMSKRELRKYLQKRWLYIYYRVFEELSKLLNKIDFLRKTIYPSSKELPVLYLFPKWEVSL